MQTTGSFVGWAKPKACPTECADVGHAALCPTYEGAGYLHHAASGLVQYHVCKVAGSGIMRVASVGHTSTHLPQAVQASLNTA